MTDDKQLALAYLSRVAEPPCAELISLIRRVGAVEAAGRVKTQQVSPELARQTKARREIDSAEKDLEVLAHHRGRLVGPDDPEWPVLAFTAFDDAHRDGRAVLAPIALWVVGPARLDDLSQRAAALVGTRAATAYGEHVAGELAAGLVERDVTVVSGGAYGIDGAAHRAALASEGFTVAVLAGGIDVPYPSGHSALLHRIGTHGLIVSEYPPGTRPARHRFLTRNRLVAALSGATVVVEAGVRSGAANTAAWARALGRSVCAVPGPVTSAASTGCHVLLRGRGGESDRATLVTRADEIVEEMGRIGEFAAEREGPTSALDGLSDDELRVYEALPARGKRSVDEIAVGCGLPATAVLGPLSLLEVQGLVSRQDGYWKLARR